MKCPLLVWGVLAGTPYKYMKDTDCLKEECAWWDKLGNQCLAHSITTAFEGMAANLNRIEEKMPHEGQFRR